MKYEFKTPLWIDFTVADMFGVESIEKTFNEIFETKKDDVVYITELIIVTNWKLGAYYNSYEETKDFEDFKYSKVYDKLYKKANLYAKLNFQDKDLKYFLNTTD